MNRLKNYTEMDAVPVIDGDTGFRGVDERTNPAQLGPGWVSYSENLRYRNGVAEPRKGDQLLLSMTGGGATPWSEIYTAGRWQSPATGQELWLVAADGNTYYTAPGIGAVEIPLPSGVTLTAATAVQFVQCFNVVILLRGEQEEPLVMRKFDVGFEFINQTTTGTGTVTIPPSAFGLFYQNRLLLIRGGDQVVASDLLDYTRYSIFNELRINQGDNDRLVAMHPFNESTLLMLKDQSVWRVDNIYGDLSDMALRNVTTKYGCVAPFSVVDYGTDVAWLSERGIVTLKLTEQNQIQGTDVSLSDPLPRTMARVNWAYAANCVAESWDNKLYFALPLDEAEVLSATNLATTGGATYTASNLTVTGLTAGARYKYTQADAADHYCINGNNRLDGSGYFIAASTTVQINGTDDAAVTATIVEVLHEGVNNGVLVFDNVTQAWAGVDTRSGLNIRRWTKQTINGLTRLCYVSNDGETRIYEEGLTDETLQAVNPAYIDVVAVDFPANGVTLQIGGGTLVTADDGSATNTGAAGWGVAPASLTIREIGNNLWSNNDRGYASTNGTAWTYGGAYALQQLSGGLRITSTNATLPTVAVDGSAVTASGFYGTNQDSNLPEAAFYVDCVSGTRPLPLQIATTLETRGYLGGMPGLKKFNDAQVEIATWNPTYGITRLLDGVAKSRVYDSAVTRDRALSMSGAAWDTTNAGLDHFSPDREDYSIVLDDGQIGVYFDPAGVYLEAEQAFSRRIGFSQEEGRYCRLKFTNTTGRLTVRAAHVEAREGARSYLTTT
jgi:hypothetical protein